MDKISFGNCLSQGFSKIEWLKDKNQINDFEEFFENFSVENSKKFIDGYFEKREKGSVLKEVLVDDSIVSKGVHSVAVFLLGMYCYQELGIKGALLKKIGGRERKNFDEKLEEYNFEYFWFLTALYHDLSAEIEKNLSVQNSKVAKKILKFMSDDTCNDIEHNVLNDKRLKKNENPIKFDYTYETSLIKNYFKYRLQKNKKIDHGIAAGILAYSKLCENLEKILDGQELDWQKNVTVGNMIFSKNDYIAYGIVADAIMAHNMWFAYENTEIEQYRENGLDYLVYEEKFSGEEDHRLSPTNNPLAFYLGLIDTIEPFKYFDCKCMNKKCIADNIKFEVSGKRIIISTANDKDIKEWYIEKIKELQYWMKVSCKYENNKIIINTKPKGSSDN